MSEIHLDLHAIDQYMIGRSPEWYRWFSTLTIYQQSALALGEIWPVEARKDDEDERSGVAR